MTYSYLLIEKTGATATLTINSPKTLNALNSSILKELETAFLELGDDETVKVIVLTGAGQKAFVAGADISEMCSMDALQAHDFAAKGQQLMLQIEKMTKPVIAAVNGYALGGGLELALAADFIYASDCAKFGFPEVTLGVIPGFGGTQNLSRLIGKNKANELVFSGNLIDAQQALKWGIVNQTFTPEELLPKTLEIAAKIAAAGTLAVNYAKDAICNGLQMSKENGFRYEASLFSILFTSSDQKEGMAAFLEKRKANFKGK